MDWGPDPMNNHESQINCTFPPNQKQPRPTFPTYKDDNMGVIVNTSDAAICKNIQRCTLTLKRDDGNFKFSNVLSCFRINQEDGCVFFDKSFC